MTISELKFKLENLTQEYVAFNKYVNSLSPIQQNQLTNMAPKCFDAVKNNLPFAADSAFSFNIVKQQIGHLEYYAASFRKTLGPMGLKLMSTGSVLIGGIFVATSAWWNSRKTERNTLS